MPDAVVAPVPAPAPASAPAAAPSASAPAAVMPPAAPPAFNANNPPAGANQHPIEEDPFTKFDKEKPAPVDKGEKTPVDKPPGDKTPQDKPQEKPPGEDDKPTDKTKPPGDPKDKKSGWARFREAERNLAEFKKNVAKEKADLEAKLKEAEARASGEFKIDEHPEFKKSSEARTAAEKRAKELEERLKYYDYEQSDEFKQKFYTPYVRTWQESISAIGEMMVPDSNGGTRAATKDDLIAVVQAKSDEEATRIAEEIFGNPTKAALAIWQRRQILAAHKNMEQAKVDFASQASEMRKQSEQQAEAAAIERAQKFNQFLTEGVEKHPDWFKPVDGDDEGNAVLERGYMIADAIFGGKFIDKDGKERELTPDEMINFHASVRNKAGAFDRMVLTNQKLLEKIKSLEDELADYRETAPPDGEHRVGQTEGDPDLAMPQLLRG